MKNRYKKKSFMKYKWWWIGVIPLGFIGGITFWAYILGILVMTAYIEEIG